MIPLTLGEIADAVEASLGGGARPDAVVTGAVRTDSRAVAEGDLFVAVVGSVHDAHDFAASAVASGAVAVLASQPLEVPCIVVADTVVALGLLARAVLDRLEDVVVVAVTGSSGKTSVKDLLAQVLTSYGPTVSPRGSFNNEIGVPITALEVDRDTRVLLCEMGSRGPGHIRYLMTVAPPRIGVVLNVGSAHVGEFGSREITAQSKGELVEGLPDSAMGGVAVLNADDALVVGMRGRTQARVVTFGVTAEADIRAESIVLDELGRPSFTLRAGGNVAPVTLGLHGAHHVLNALAAAAVALTLGIDFGTVATALSRSRPASRWRMEVTETPSGVTVVNDAYNANPESVRAALQALVAMSGPTPSHPLRRTVAVLGEMRELGEASQAEHEDIGRTAVRLGIDRLVIVGTDAAGVPAAALARGAAGLRATIVPDVDAALALLREELSSGDVVLVKASRAAGLERVAMSLVESLSPGVGA